MGAEWAFLSPGSGGDAGEAAEEGAESLTVPAFDPGRLAVAAANGSRWIVRRRARRILATAQEWSEGDNEVVAALARGRVEARPESRLADDLLLTSARLRDVAFRVWSHHAHVSAAEWALSEDTSPEALARHLSSCGYLPLWGADETPPGDGAPRAQRGRSGAFAEALRQAFGELRVLVDEIAARAVASGVVADKEALEQVDWNALPELVGSLPDVPERTGPTAL
jgi:hypothetical protein